MGFRFSRRVRILPGVHVNLSKSGASVSVGPRGAKHTIGPKGSRTTVGIPGTGISHTSRTNKSSDVGSSFVRIVIAVLFITIVIAMVWGSVRS